MRSRNVTVTINLDVVRANAEAIRRKTNVPLIAVVKSDAYGLGAPRVADTLASVADEFAYFALHEAREVRRPGIVLGPPDGTPAEHRELRLRPAIATLEHARRFSGIDVLIEVDTGMQRFGCPPARLDELIAASGAREAFSHAVTLDAVHKLQQACGGRGLRLHAAATSLLDWPEAYLDGVRPGLALYRGSVRVTTPLALARETRGPVGYTGFACPRVGVILAGYAQHLRPGPVVINGRRQRLLEIGMNTSFVSVADGDRVGDEVVLLGDALTEAELASALQIREHEVLCRYTSMGVRAYTPPVATDDQETKGSRDRGIKGSRSEPRP